MCSEQLFARLKGLARMLGERALHLEQASCRMDLRKLSLWVFEGKALLLRCQDVWLGQQRAGCGRRRCCRRTGASARPARRCGGIQSVRPTGRWTIRRSCWRSSMAAPKSLTATMTWRGLRSTHTGPSLSPGHICPSPCSLDTSLPLPILLDAETHAPDVLCLRLSMSWPALEG
jgi:hypothetical protein